jgi:FKBP-type peptidyl-prolyl cis-trans isomerase (trigger factor)
MQERIQQEILTLLRQNTSHERLPETAFLEFVRHRFQTELEEAIEHGMIQQADIEKYATEQAFQKYMDERRDVMEDEFRALISLDHIFQEENLQVDEDLVQAQVDSYMKEAENMNPPPQEVCWQCFEPHIYTRLCESFTEAHARGMIAPVTKQRVHVPHTIAIKMYTDTVMLNDLWCLRSRHRAQYTLYCADA